MRVITRPKLPKHISNDGYFVWFILINKRRKKEHRLIIIIYLFFNTKINVCLPVCRELFASLFVEACAQGVDCDWQRVLFSASIS